MPEARQNSSKLAEMLAIASSFNALGGTAVDVVGLFMALLSFVESAPRAYRLKASNAAPPISTSIGTIPKIAVGVENLAIERELDNCLRFADGGNLTLVIGILQLLLGYVGRELGDLKRLAVQIE